MADQQTDLEAWREWADWFVGYMRGVEFVGGDVEFISIPIDRSERQLPIRHAVSVIAGE